MAHLAWCAAIFNQLNFTNMNKELLFQLYAIHSKSGNEKKMRRYLRKQAAACGATSIVTDNYGNLLIIKGESDTYPCLAAHMDQVQTIHSKDFRAVEIDDDCVIGWSSKHHEQQGLGADDKNGIFICLELLRKFDVMKVAFFVGEETGCIGSSRVDLGFFKDCRFIIQPDRKGSGDLITSMFCGEVCSEKFYEAIGYKDYGYKHEIGSITDVGELIERGVGISCLNLSCGYYEAHSDVEYTILSELENCMNFVEHIVATCTDVYPFEGGYGDLYGSYGRYGQNYGWYGGKCYGEKKEETWYDRLCTQMGRKSQSTESNDRYFFDGRYDEDYGIMEDYFSIEPGLSFDSIETYYLADFNAYYDFPKKEAIEILRDIYDDTKENLYIHSDFWGEDKDSDAECELSFDDVTLKKVS